MIVNSLVIALFIVTHVLVVRSYRSEYSNKRSGERWNVNSRKRITLSTL